MDLKGSPSVKFHIVAKNRELLISDVYLFGCLEPVLSCQANFPPYPHKFHPYLNEEPGLL